MVKDLIRDVAQWAAKNSAFVLTFMAMTGAMLLALSKDADVNTLLPTLLGLFLGQRAGTSAAAFMAAAKDEKCDTRKVINDLEGHGSGE